jgi:hypothetical protein
MTISPHVVYAGEDVTATTTAQTADCAAPGGTPGQSWSWQDVPGTVVSGCTVDSPTCEWKAGATGGWTQYCMSGAAWVGPWDSCDYYGSVGGTPTIAVSVSPGSIKANGKSVTTVTATVSDTGSPETGDDISFSSSDGGQSIGAVTDNGDGTYTATITASKKSGNATITASDTSSSPTVAATTTLTSTPATVSTTTGVTCAAQASPAGTFSCTATVAPSSATGGVLPSGSVDWSVPTASLSASSCALAADPSAGSATCAVVVTPTQTGNESDLPVTADYGGDENYEPSTGGGDAPDSVIPAVVLSAAPVTVDTYLDQSGSAAKFNLKLSRAASTPVTVSYETQDGSGDDGLKASEGDYKPAKGTLTFPAGTTDETVAVQVYADITVRVDSGFDLLLGSLEGAAFPPTDASASLRARERPADATAPSEVKVAGKVVPDLTAGTITKVKLMQVSAAHQQEKLSEPISLQPYKSSARLALTNLIKFTDEGLTHRTHVGDDLVTRRGTRECYFALKGLVEVSPGSGIKVKSQMYDKTVDGIRYEEIRHRIRIPETTRDGAHVWVQIDMSGGILTATS